MSSTLTTLARFAANEGTRPAVRSGEYRSSYAGLADSAKAVALKLVRANVSVIALAADNGPEWLIVDLAARMADVVLVPLPPFFSAEQTAHALLDSGVEAVVAPAAVAARMGLAANDHSPAVELVGDLLLHPRDALPAELPPAASKISYTSGTTGRPKGVSLTQAGMDAVAASLSTALVDLELTRHLCALPLATLLENIAGVYAPLMNGAEIVVPPLAEVGIGGATAFDPLRFLRCVEAYRPESVILLPQMLAALMAAVERGAPHPTSLRFIAVGGARVAASLLSRAERLGLPVYEGYGLTECGSVVALNTPAGRRSGSVGRPLPHAQVEVDATGEILVSGPAVAGYVGGSGVPAQVATGDLGYLDADGYLYVSGRRKNVFITSFGRNVSPEWVESELTAEPELAQVAVFGEARPWNVAVVVPRRASATPADVHAAIERVNARLPDYARVHDWVFAGAPFTPANGLLTTNGRNRRAAIWARYAARVDAVYDRAVERIA